MQAYNEEHDVKSAEELRARHTDQQDTKEASAADAANDPGRTFGIREEGGLHGGGKANGVECNTHCVGGVKEKADGATKLWAKRSAKDHLLG